MTVKVMSEKDAVHLDGDLALRFARVTRFFDSRGTPDWVLGRTPPIIAPVRLNVDFEHRWNFQQRSHTVKAHLLLGATEGAISFYGSRAVGSYALGTRDLSRIRRLLPADMVSWEPLDWFWALMATRPRVGYADTGLATGPAKPVRII